MSPTGGGIHGRFTIQAAPTARPFFLPGFSLESRSWRSASRAPGPRRAVSRYNGRKGRNAMPLRDHFPPPAAKMASWEAVHGGWPMVIVQSLARRLPHRYVAYPRVHLGSFAEIDVSAYE